VKSERAALDKDPDALKKVVVVGSDGSNFVAVTEKGSDFESTFGLSDYGELVRKLYAEKLAASIHVADSARVGGTPALRFPFEGVYKGVRVKGFLYVTKGKSDFVHALAFTISSDFQRLKPRLLSVMESATVD
jgi:hypothetical protein